MHISSRKFLTVAVVLAFLAPAASAQISGVPFSADMTMTAQNTTSATGKLYFNPPKHRIDMNMQGRQATMIFDSADKVTYMLMPEQKMYMEMSGEGPMGRGPQLPKAKPMDPKNPCANDESMTCQKVGTETVNGRTTDHWQFTAKDGRRENFNAWIDQKLHFPVKTETSGGDKVELTNIQEGAQAGSLFEIPSGYRKFDMGGRMQDMPPQP